MNTSAFTARQAGHPACKGEVHRHLPSHLPSAINARQSAWSRDLHTAACCHTSVVHHSCQQHWPVTWQHQKLFAWHRHRQRRTVPCPAAVARSQDSDGNSKQDEVYPLEKTKVLVETAMLAAVGGLAYLLSSILKLETTLGYFLPLPVVLSAMRGGAAAGWKTMMSTAFLLVVLLGPLKAVSYVLMHGLLAATLGTLWKRQTNFWVCTLAGSLVRMGGMLAYLVLSSVTMNENLFAIMMSNVYAMLDQAVWALMGAQGSPPTFAIISMLSAMVLVSASCYVFLLQVIYRIILQAMGYYLGPLPNIIRKYLYAGMPDPEAAARQYG